jgi:sugar O-acyltransferase (sialic acid O-acetyltransferase NeuD family)
VSKPKLLLIGAGGHANSCIDVIEQEGKFEIAGLIGLPDQVGTKHFNYEVIGTDSELESFLIQFKFALVTVGQVENAKVRIRLYERIKTIGFNVPSIKSKSAYVSNHAIISDGTIIMHNVIVNSGVHIGENCIVNTSSLIEHDVKVSNHCHISTGVTVNGGVRIGSNTFIGSRSVIRENLSIGDNCVIGMGTVLLNDMSSESKIVGSK